MTTENKPSEERVIAGARALCKLNAEVCGIEADDNWKHYSDDFKEGARAVLTAADAAGAQQGVALRQAAPSGEVVATVGFSTQQWRALVVALTELPDGTKLYTHPAPAPAESVRTNAVPAGYVLVPVELTPEMVEALEDNAGPGYVDRECAPRVWAAMLSAAPQIPAVPAGWMPIETAPRGSGEGGPSNVRDPAYVEPPTLLLWTQEGPRVGYYDWYYHPGYGRGADPHESPWRCADGGQAYGPTHWMPLPPPPSQPPSAANEQKGGA